MSVLTSKIALVLHNHVGQETVQIFGGDSHLLQVIKSLHLLSADCTFSLHTSNHHGTVKLTKTEFSVTHSLTLKSSGMRSIKSPEGG